MLCICNNNPMVETINIGSSIFNNFNKYQHSFVPNLMRIILCQTLVVGLVLCLHWTWRKRNVKFLRSSFMILTGNHSEIINSIYLRMLSIVAMRNVPIGANEEVLHIIKGVQIGDPNVNRELGLDKNKGKNNA